MRRIQRYRGSRKHVLDWVQSPDFLDQLTSLLQPSMAIPVVGTCMPRGHSSPKEARLDWYGPRYLPDTIDWDPLRHWWLVHQRGANTPNWDLALVARIEGHPGLVLVEAKANVQELKTEGKVLPATASEHSKDNHVKIQAAIAEAQLGLTNLVPGIRLGVASHYQLANRLAFAWKLASLSLPVVMVYLGFTGDVGIQDVGEPFGDEDHWLAAFAQHSAPVAPPGLFERCLEINRTPLWVLVRSRVVLEPSSSLGVL